MKKIFVFTVEIIFSRYAGTCLKFILQNIFLKSLRFQFVTFDLPKTDVTKDENIFRSKEINFSEEVKNVF